MVTVKSLFHDLFKVHFINNASKTQQNTVVAPQKNGINGYDMSAEENVEQVLCI